MEVVWESGYKQGCSELENPIGIETIARIVN